MPAEDLIQDFQAAADVRKLGFAEFTTDLISDTADASVATTASAIGGGLRLGGLFSWAGLGFSGRRSNITVETADTRSFAAITTRADIFGEVRVSCATESFDLERMKIEAEKPGA